jgi:hypothetical protein
MSKFDSLYKEVLGEDYLPAKVKSRRLFALGPIDYGHYDNPNELGPDAFFEGTSAQDIISDLTDDIYDYQLERTVDGVQVWGADEFVIYIGTDKNKIKAVAVADYEAGGRTNQ